MHIVKLKVPWYSQFDEVHVERAGNAACFRTCRAMAKAVNVIIPESTLNRIQVASGVTNENRVIVSPVQFMRALEYVQASIYHWGEPVVIGVNYKPGGPNRDNITDHFVLIYGIIVNEKSEVTYCVLDPGRKESDKETLWNVKKIEGGSWSLQRVTPTTPLQEMSMLVPAMGRAV